MKDKRKHLNKMEKKFTYVQAIFVRQFSNTTVGFKKYLFKTEIDKESLKDIYLHKLLIKDERYSNYIQIVGFPQDSIGRQMEAELSFEGIKLVDLMIEYATESPREIHKSYIRLGRKDTKEIMPIPMTQRVQGNLGYVEQTEIKKSTTRKFIKY